MLTLVLIFIGGGRSSLMRVICRLLFTVAVDVVRGQFLFPFDIDEQFPFEFIVVVKLQKDLQNTHTYTTRSTSPCMFEHTGGS